MVASIDYNMNKKIISFIIISLVIIVAVIAFVLAKKKNQLPIEIVPLSTVNQGALQDEKETPDEAGEGEMRIFVSFPKPENDADGDGVKDDVEAKMKTSNTTNDTDGDGLTDKIEIEKYKSDPTKFDTDGDGFADGVEVVNGYNPAGPGKLSTE